jgi:hypothetical protein
MPQLTMVRKLIAACAVVGVGMFGITAPPANAEPESANFTSPSRNIDCLIYLLDDTTSASCDVRNASWKTNKRKPADCDLDWSPTEAYVQSALTNGTTINSVGLGVCRGDIGPDCPDACRTLGYGKSETIGRITCTSQKTGMTCVTNKGKRKGFTVNRSGYKLIR